MGTLPDTMGGAPVAEEAADDEALYDVWRRLDPDTVRRVHLLVAILVILRRRGGPPNDDEIARARELRDGPLGLGHLPIVQEVLDNS